MDDAPEIPLPEEAVECDMEASLYTQCERRLFEQFIFFRMFPEYPLKDGVSPQSIFPDWHSFELCSFVTAGGLEKNVLISPALNGDLAFPIMSTSDLENKAIPLCLLVNRYDCREWDNLNVEHIIPGLSQQFLIWTTVMTSFTLERMSSFSSNGIQGTLVLWRTLERCRCLYEKLTEVEIGCDVSDCLLDFLTSFSIFSDRLDTWNKSLRDVTETSVNSNLWKSARLTLNSVCIRPCDTQFQDWLLSYVDSRRMRQT
jgi:hypothetical protein